jgi:hypothetical protein
LKDKGKLDLPEALLFETGSNQWRRYSAWPPRQNVTERKLYFRSGKRLSFDPPRWSVQWAGGNREPGLQDPRRRNRRDRPGARGWSILRAARPRRSFWRALRKRGVALPGESFSTEVNFPVLRLGPIGFPAVTGCYVHVSETTEPIRVEIFSELGETQIEEAARRAYLYSRLLPGYGLSCAERCGNGPPDSGRLRAQPGPRPSGARRDKHDGGRAARPRAARQLP